MQQNEDIERLTDIVERLATLRAEVTQLKERTDWRNLGSR